MRDHQPSPSHASFSLVEHVAQALYLSVGPANFMTSAAARTSCSQEASKRQFAKLFDLLLIYLGHKDEAMYKQGLLALKLMTNSHFALFLQEEPHILQLLRLCSPAKLGKKAVLAELPEGEEASKTVDKAAEVVIPAILDQLSALCRSQIHVYFRCTIITTPSIFNKIVTNLLWAFENGTKPAYSSYEKLFHAICMGPELAPKAPQKKARRQIYIPGET